MVFSWFPPTSAKRGGGGFVPIVASCLLKQLVSLTVGSPPFLRFDLDPARRATDDIGCHAPLADDAFEALSGGRNEQLFSVIDDDRWSR